MKTLFKNITFYISCLYILASLYFIYQFIRYPLLPIKYLSIIIAVIIVLGILLILAIYKIKNKKVNIFVKILTVLISIALLIANVFYNQTTDLFNNITITEDTDIVSVLVMNNSSYQKIEDLKEHQFGILDNQDHFVDETINKILEIYQTDTLDITKYTSITELIDALYNNRVDSIIINDAYIEVISEFNESFKEDTRIIYSNTMVSEVIQEEEKEEVLEPLNVIKDTFNIYISGIDTYGKITTKSRSDVNMIVTVNPRNKQILLTSIPRDYYIPFNVLNGKRDKLTHSGIYGVNETKNNVSSYFDLRIDYYVRVNFTSLIDIVDALGGIDVSLPDDISKAFDFKQIGNNLYHINGKEALILSRERYSFGGGDGTRIKNQARVITGIINKATSPAIITNYMELLDSLESSFQTNLTDNELMSLIRMQLDDMSSWSITTQSVSGKGASLYSPIYGSKLYMNVPDDSSVKSAANKIRSMY